MRPETTCSNRADTCVRATNVPLKMCVLYLDGKIMQSSRAHGAYGAPSPRVIVVGGRTTVSDDDYARRYLIEMFTSESVNVQGVAGNRKALK